MSDVMSWDDAIENDEPKFIILPEGDYNFTVRSFERGQFKGSTKLEASPKAMLTLDVHTDNGDVTVTSDLILNRKLEWKICQFFKSIGQKKHGEKLSPNWQKVAGSQGRAHFKPRSYINQNGEEHQANNVDKFLDYDEKFFENDFVPVPEGDESVPFFN